MKLTIDVALADPEYKQETWPARLVAKDPDYFWSRAIQAAHAYAAKHEGVRLIPGYEISYELVSREKPHDMFGGLIFQPIIYLCVTFHLESSGQ